MLQTEYQDDFHVKKYSNPLTKCHSKFISELHIINVGHEVIS